MWDSKAFAQFFYICLYIKVLFYSALTKTEPRDSILIFCSDKGGV